jgi:hypothetical protein
MGEYYMINWKNKLLVGTMAGGIILGGLTGCADGKDQDNGIDDGQKNDQIDDAEMNDENNMEEENNTEGTETEGTEAEDTTTDDSSS